MRHTLSIEVIRGKTIGKTHEKHTIPLSSKNKKPNILEIFAKNITRIRMRTMDTGNEILPRGMYNTVGTCEELTTWGFSWNFNSVCKWFGLEKKAKDFVVFIWGSILPLKTECNRLVFYL